MILPVKAYFASKKEIVDVVGQCLWIGADHSGAIGSLSGRLA